MNIKKILFFILIFGLGIIQASADENQKIDVSKLTQVPNATLLDDQFIGAGAPSQEGLEQAKKQGIHTIIDLRSPEEGTLEEAQQAEALGLRYVNIPMSVSNFSEAQANQISETLKTAEKTPVLLHCATGQRAAAAWALYRNRHDGVSSTQALQDAEANGLKKPELKTKLQSLLQAPEKTTVQS